MFGAFDLRRLLSWAPVYGTFQRTVGGSFAERLVREYYKPRPGERVLEIGCGPGNLLQHLPEVEYVGFDLSRKYIEAARKRYGERGRFFCQRVSQSTLEQFRSFDLVVAMSVIHHLDDDEARHLFQLAHKALKPGGRFVSIDPCFHDDQSRMARTIISWDRGKHVRGHREYPQLAEPVVGDVKVEIRRDLARIPYTHIIMQFTAEESS